MCNQCQIVGEMGYYIRAKVGLLPMKKTHSNSSFMLFCIILFWQIFAWVGFAVAVVWIYSIANEIVNLLQVCVGLHPLLHHARPHPSLHRTLLPCYCVFRAHTHSQAFGIVIKLSDGILGLTLLAWGNSIGG